MKKITIQTYGATENNPGPAAIACRVSEEDKGKLFEFSESIGNATASYAQFYAVAQALQVTREELAEKLSEYEYVLQLSNESVKKQLNGEKIIDNPSLVPLFVEVHNIRVESFSKLAVELVPEDSAKEVKDLAEKVLTA